ncbi:hypothetical protein PsorP6_012540 [Peronosclerospora sorghi]|uniref:Uncharacterized protein n=1 Tax=Peronosclerospora sorghi TaxID=230839 RepID=A0ACC0WGN9_9STRA|nr:hypothetical protein PsorP6_012540 [Peronosclerospora sorghi]
MIHTLSPAFHAKTQRLYADLMLAKRKFKRAIRHSCRDMGVVTNEQELETKLKVARYYYSRSNSSGMVECSIVASKLYLEGFNGLKSGIFVGKQLKSTLRDKRCLSMNLLLGKLYLN